jgi:hypothetical protein
MYPSLHIKLLHQEENYHEMREEMTVMNEIVARGKLT